MMNEFKGSEKTIRFDCCHPQIENLMIQVVNQCCGFVDMNQSFIKWVITYDTDLFPLEMIQLFVVDSLKPLRVMTGLAAMEHSYFSGINEPEEEIIKFVEGLSADDIMRLSASAIPIGYNDKMQLYKQAGTPLQLANGNEYTDRIEGVDDLLPVEEIFNPRRLINLQTRNKNSYAPVNLYIKKKYGMQSLEELILMGMNEEDAREIEEIVKELTKNS